ncbi:MAG: hypothetical protein GY822_30110 [Deltaproteobacteria bacterium]|nr:hypothetical protein [Deltaproteobacteria bacterium]
MSLLVCHTDELSKKVAGLEKVHLPCGPQSLIRAFARDESFVQLRSTTTNAEYSAQNQLLSLDGGEMLAHAARLARRHEALFPIARPFPLMRMAEAALHFPAFVEGFFSGVSGVSPRGAAVKTPLAPRSAQGPDPFGLLLGGCLLAQRIQLRVFSKETTSWRSVQLPTKEAASLLQALLAEGRAFVVDAQAISSVGVGKVQVFVLSGNGTPHLASPFSEVAEPAYPRTCRLPRSGTMDSSRDMEQFVGHFDDGKRALAAPFMHRLGWLSKEPSSRVIRASEAFAADLCVPLFTNSSPRLDANASTEPAFNDEGASGVS